MFKNVSNEKYREMEVIRKIYIDKYGIIEGMKMYAAYESEVIANVESKSKSSE